MSASFANYKRWSFAWKCVYRTGLFYCVAHTVGRHCGELVICSGPSMRPTIEDGDLVIAERFSVSQGNILKGDIVGCLNPHDSSQLLCKRIAAKEGDFVTPTMLLPSGKVPRGHVYLLGDNVGASTDSRHIGPIPEGLVQIRLSLRVWPLTRAGWLSDRWWYESEK